MVTEVQAFSDAEGKLHKSKLEALEADAAVTLNRMSVFNYASALAVVHNAEEIVKVLQPIVAEREALSVKKA